jgi:hypothetical protein
MVGRFFEAGGSPHEVSVWLRVMVWPVLVLVAVLVRPRNG